MIKSTSSKIMQSKSISTNQKQLKPQNTGSFDTWRSKVNIPQQIQTAVNITDQINSLKLPFDKQSLNNLLKIEKITGSNNEKDTILFDNNLCYLKFENNSFYYGQAKNTRKMGKAIFKYPNAMQSPDKRFYYIGNYADDLFNGYGKLIVMPNSQAKEGRVIYDGNWLNGKKEGQGTYFYIEQQMKNCFYQGNWHDGKRFGYGVQYLQSVIYEGNWQNNKKKGKGKLTINETQTKIIYDGIWEDRQIIQQGTITYFDSKTFKENGKYTGFIKQGLRNQTGQLLIYPKALQFKGKFSNDHITHGELTVQNFQVQGDFINGLPAKNLKGKLFYSSGNVFQGQIAGDQKTRTLIPLFGKLRYLNQSTIQGNFYTGKGQFIYFNAKDQSTEKIYVQ